MHQNSQLRSLIRMILQEDAKDLVGNYLWPSGRNSQATKLHKLPLWASDEERKVIMNDIEPDTAREAELRKIVINFIMNHLRNPLDQAAVDDLLTIASDPTYKDTLAMYKRGSAFRGVSVSAGWFERNFGVSYDSILENNTGSSTQLWKSNFEVIQTIQKSGVINSNRPADSWSKKLDVAADFASGGGASGADFSVPIVYEASAKDNTFIDISIAGYDLEDSWVGDSLKKRNSEKEVLSVGPVRISSVHVLAWKGRTSAKSLPGVFKAGGTGYDDVGSDDVAFNTRVINPRDLDSRFDALGIPDIG